MEKYFLITDQATQNYLNTIFTNNKFITLTSAPLEDDAIIFIHIQSQQNITKTLQSFQNSKVALLSDRPSFHEGYNLLMKFPNIKAYANTYMAKTHYKQLLWMLKSDNNWFYPEFTQEFLSFLSAKKENTSVLNKLTAKEQEVAKLVAKKLKNGDIAQQLNIKERTVKQHLSNIFEKLQIKDRLTLALMLQK